MKKYFLTAALLLVSALSAAVIDCRTVVVQEPAAIATEKNAAKILADTLTRMFGSPVRVVAAGDYDGKSPAIFLKTAELAPEEWCIEAVGNNVTISGGRTLGVLYGVYEFLEKFGNCRYFAPYALHIPGCSSFAVPDGRRFQRQPAFRRRVIHTPFQNPENAAFNSWNKVNGSFCALNENHIPLEEEYLYKTDRQLGGGGHSFYFWSKEFPAEHPEYFSMSADGRRLRAVSAAGPGQICLSHPEVRKLMKEKVQRVLREDREKAAKYGYLPATVVNLTHNDNDGYCVCPGCKALLAKYGAWSGAMLDFVNDIAACAPETQFETFAYTFTEEPPRNIKPAANVSVYMAFLGPELMNGKCDTMRSLVSHPNNGETRRFIQDWGTLSKTLSIWLYQRLYRQEFPSPIAMVWNIGPDLRYLRKSGVNRIFVESEYEDLEGEIGPRSFHELHEYVVRKLLDDPELDEKTLISEFITCYYGPAAPEMTGYLNYLQRRLAEESGMLGKIAVHNRAYLDAEFLCTCNQLLTRAQAKVAADPVRSRRVAMEFLPLDFAAVNMWERLPELPGKYGLTREALLDRLERNGRTALEVILTGPDTGSKLAASIKQLQDKVRLLRHPLPVPPELKHRSFVQHIAASFAFDKVTDDAEAIGGKALVTSPGSAHNLPVELGIYTRHNKAHLRRWYIPGEKIARDEQYHLYYLGSSVLPGPETNPVFWAHQSWTIPLSNSLKNAFRPQDSSRVYDIFVSAKFTGPAYCPGSTKPNAMAVDRVFYAERADDRALPAEFRGREGKVYLLNDFQCSRIFPKNIDPDAAGGAAVAVPKRAVPMEFGFYDRKLKKKLFQKNFPAAQFAVDGKYHLYLLGTPDLPQSGEEFVFWGDETWELNFNDILRDFTAIGAGKKWEIWVSVKADAANLHLDRVIFVEKKGK